MRFYLRPVSWLTARAAEQAAWFGRALRSASSIQWTPACQASIRVVDEIGIDCDSALPGCWEIEHRKAKPSRMLPWSDDGRPVSVARTVSGGVVQPAALTLGIAQAAARLGAIIREHSPVTRINLGPELSLEVGGQRVNPGHVVVGANAWINAILADTPPLHSSLTFACVTEPLDDATLAAIGLDQGVPFYTKDLPYLWGRTIRDGRVIFGAGLIFGEAPDLEETDVREGDSAAVLDRLQKRVRGLHPALREIRFDAAWAGPIAFAKDSIPLLGPYPANPRVPVSGGYAGHGVALSVRAGELLALAIGETGRYPSGARSRAGSRRTSAEGSPSRRAKKNGFPRLGDEIGQRRSPGDEPHREG